MTDKPTHLTIKQFRVVIDVLKIITEKQWQTLHAINDKDIGDFKRGYRAGLNECSALAEGALKYLERVTNG